MSMNTFDSQGLGGFDLNLNMEQLNRELLAFVQTAEGKQFFLDQGIDPNLVGGGIAKPTGVAKPTSSEGSEVVDTYYEGSGPSRMRITVFANGYIKKVLADEGDGSNLVFSPNPDARNTIKAVLST